MKDLCYEVMKDVYGEYFVDRENLPGAQVLEMAKEYVERYWLSGCGMTSDGAPKWFDKSKNTSLSAIASWAHIQCFARCTASIRFCFLL